MKKRISMTPLKIGGITIKNRYQAGAVTGRFLLYDQTGGYTPNGVEYQVAYARGGFGLIVTGSNYGDQTVDPFNILSDKPSPLYAPKISGYTFRTVTERVHQYGSKIFLQVAFGPGRMRNGKAPSVLPTLKDPSKFTEELTREEIERLLSEAIRLAEYAKSNGFDGVEIHAHFGYLLDQFEMKCTNLRTDEYGGDLDGRLTVYRKLITGIKQACGKDFPVAIRMALKTYMKSFTEASLDGSCEFGRDIDETIEVAKKLESYGIDMFNFNSGTYESHYYCVNPYYMEKGYNLELAKRVKKEVSVPVFCTGLMDDAEMCEQALEKGDIDGITICRAAMVDTQYARKVSEERISDIRPCIQCCSCEHWNLKTGVPLCSANPAAMREWSYGIPKAAVSKKIAVIGGGIGGLVSAHTAALAGHQVTLYEKEKQVGGHMLDAAQQSFKTGIGKLNQWYQHELKKLGVPVHTGCEMTAEAIKKLDTDIVILATGSTYAVPQISGIESANIHYAPEILKNSHALGKLLGENVAVIGGGCVGGEIAYDLAANHQKKVTLIEQKSAIAKDSVTTDDVHQMLNELLAYHHVDILCDTRAVAVDEHSVTVESKGTQEQLAADSIIAATGVAPVPSLYDELKGSGLELYEVGDIIGNLNTIQTTSAQAYEIARSL